MSIVTITTTATIKGTGTTTTKASQYEFVAQKKDPAKAIAFNRTLSPAANVGLKSGRRGYFSS